MATSIPFTDNYEDLSTEQGFQFKFYCERCGNGYMSSFSRNAVGMAGDALRAASGLFGGLLGRAAESTFDIQRMVGGPQHDGALTKAVEEISPLFSQCGRCGNWVCRNVCFNGERNQCCNCSPKMDQEIAAIESIGTITQLREKASDGSVDLIGGVQLTSAAGGQNSVAASVSCPQCHAEVTQGAKFCHGCGAKVQNKLFCPQCGIENAPGAKFCSDCGTKMS